MDSFHRVEFTGTWKKLFARVQKHVIWSVLKSVTGMQVNNYELDSWFMNYDYSEFTIWLVQGKKFKDKSTHKEPNLANVPTLDLTELCRFSGQKIYPGRGIIFACS
ncbi:putative ribosomal protein L24e/L24 superfamily [Helianthus anomalus]